MDGVTNKTFCKFFIPLVMKVRGQKEYKIGKGRINPISKRKINQFYISITVYAQYNFLLVSGVQHSG